LSVIVLAIVLSVILLAIVLSVIVLAIVLSVILLAIVLSVILRLRAYDYPFGIFKLFWVILFQPIVVLIPNDL
jgi:hypothetical protein